MNAQSAYPIEALAPKITSKFRTLSAAGFRRAKIVTGGSMRDLKQNHQTNRLFRLIRLRQTLDRRAVRLRLAAELVTAISGRHSDLSNDTKTRLN